MVPVSYYKSRPDRWSTPRWISDPCERRRIYGAVQPMEHKPGLIAWLLLGRTTD